MNLHRYIVFAIILSLSTNFSSGQEIPGGKGLIPDFPSDTCFKLNLTDLFPATMDTIFGLEKLCLSLSHPDPRELDIFLQSPDGNSIEISTDNAGDDANMPAVCFSMTSSIAVSAATTFLDIDVIPEDNLGELNNGQFAPGLWQLCITDDTEGNSGELHSWKLLFGENPPAPLEAVISPVCNTNITIGCVCPGGSTNCFLLPDIIIAERVMKNQYTEYQGKLTVTTATSNIGFGPLEFRGTGEWFCGEEQVEPSEYCPNDDLPKQLVKQRIYRRFPDQNTGFVDRDAGTMQHHALEGHDHPHIDNWAQNTLRLRGSNPDPTTWPIVGSGQKISFCAENSIQCLDYNYFCEYDSVAFDVNDMPNARMGQVYECNATIQGVSVGYSDIYGQTLPGQEIYFDGYICNGKYVVVSEFDPDSIFQELDETNNIAMMEIELKMQEPDCCSVNFSPLQLQLNGSVIKFEDRSMPIPDKWIWEFGDGMASSEQFPIHEYKQPGTYSVTLSTENSLGCISFLTKTIEVDSIMVGIPYDVVNQLKFQSSIVPNPTIGKSIFSYNIQDKAFVKINLLNATGQVVNELRTLQQQFGGTYKVDIPSLDKGIYIINVELNGFNVFEKLIAL